MRRARWNNLTMSSPFRRNAGGMSRSMKSRLLIGVGWRGHVAREESESRWTYHIVLGGTFLMGACLAGMFVGLLVDPLKARHGGGSAGQTAFLAVLACYALVLVWPVVRRMQKLLDAVCRHVERGAESR